MLKKDTGQKRSFPFKGFFSKCDQICSFLRIWSHLLKKSLIENLIFCAAHHLQYECLVTQSRSVFQVSIRFYLNMFLQYAQIGNYLKRKNSKLWNVCFQKLLKKSQILQGIHNKGLFWSYSLNVTWSVS